MYGGWAVGMWNIVGDVFAQMGLAPETNPKPRHNIYWRDACAAYYCHVRFVEEQLGLRCKKCGEELVDGHHKPDPFPPFL